MGGSRDYKSIMVIRKDKDGNPILRDDGKPSMKRKYIRVTDYKRKLKAQKTAQEKARQRVINSKTKHYIDRHQIRHILNNNYDDDGNKIMRNFSRNDEFTFMNEYNSAMKNEPEITADVKRIADMIHAPVLGEKNRRKSRVSATQKRNRLAGKNDTSQMNDLVRYTNEVNSESFGKDVNKALKAYQESGYNLIQVKNFWTKPWAYKGINVTLQNKNGKFFEVQFHTKNSFTIKETVMHKVYEEQRKYKMGSPKYEQLENEMLKIADELIIEPSGVMEIKNFNWE